MALCCSESIRVRAPITRDDESSSSEFEFSESTVRWSGGTLKYESDDESFESEEELDDELDVKFDNGFENVNIERFLLDETARGDVLQAEEEGKVELVTTEECSVKERCEYFRPIAKLSFDDDITEDYELESESNHCCSRYTNPQVVAPLRVKDVGTDDEYSEMDSTGKHDLFVLSHYEVPIVSGSETESNGTEDDNAVSPLEPSMKAYAETREISLYEISVPSKLRGESPPVILPSDFLVECDHVLEEKARTSADLELIEAVFLGPLDSGEGCKNEEVLTQCYDFEPHQADSKQDDKEAQVFPLSTSSNQDDNQIASLLSTSKIVSEGIKDGKNTQEIQETMAKYFPVTKRLGIELDNSSVSLLSRLGIATGSNFKDQNSDLDTSVNILVLGKPGVGKSAIINSVFEENKVKVNPFEAGTRNVNVISGTFHGLNIRFIDTPGLRSSVKYHAISRRTLSHIRKMIKKFPPDIVLYVDRLDCHSTESDDLPLLKLITDFLAPSIWRNSIVALTHSSSPLPEEVDLLLSQRSRVIQQAINQSGRGFQHLIPVLGVENNDLLSKKEWRTQLVTMFYSLKTLSEVSSKHDHTDDSIRQNEEQHALVLSHSLSELCLEADNDDHRFNNWGSGFESPLGFSLRKSKGGNGIVALLESKAAISMNMKLSIGAKLNRKQRGKIAIKTTNSDMHIAFIAALHLISSLCKTPKIDNLN